MKILTVVLLLLAYAIQAYVKNMYPIFLQLLQLQLVLLTNSKPFV